MLDCLNYNINAKKCIYDIYINILSENLMYSYCSIYNKFSISYDSITNNIWYKNANMVNEKLYIIPTVFNSSDETCKYFKPKL